MSKGKTAFEMLRDFVSGKKEKAVEERYFNPLAVKIGAHARISNMDGFDDQLWKLTQIWAWDRQINGNSHQMADYVLESDGKWLIVRVLPQAALHNHHTLLILTQYWPDGDGPYPWGDESIPVLAGLNDSTGEFVRFGGTENEERYFRDLCDVHADVVILEDKNGCGEVVVEGGPFTLWTFRRMTNDIAGEEFEQHLHAQLSGHYGGAGRVAGGDKDILILRGEEMSALNLMIY